MTEYYDIATAFDVNYAKPAQALIGSLSFYSSEILRVHAIVPNNQLNAPEFIKLAEQFKDCWNIDLFFYSTPLIQELVENAIIHDVGYINVNTYSKLFFADVLPQEVNKLIYIDPDAFVRRNIDPLLMYPTKSDFAACLENKPWAEKLFGSPDHLYFNAGFFITNLNYWRENNLRSVAINMLKQYGQTHFMDQDILNRLFKNQFEVLPSTFNTFGDNFFEMDVLENIANPLVVHFAGGNKPWSRSRRESQWTSEWDEFADLTDIRVKKFNLYGLFRFRLVRSMWKWVPNLLKKYLKKILNKH